MEILIEKESSTPIYRQITMQITKLVQNGTLLPGDKLPPERALADSLGIARGTIKKAYLELAHNNIIEMTQGRGSFVSSVHMVEPQDRKEQAVAILTNALNDLENLKFGEKEVQNLIQIMMMERRYRQLNLSVATVDCNPESLEIFHRQLSYLSKITIKDYLLDDIMANNQAEEVLQHYDLILTTTTHYTELVGHIPLLQDKILQAAVAPSHQTIIDLASIKEKTRLGIICESKVFDRIIRNRLRSLGITTKEIKTLKYTKESRLREFLTDKDIIILPPNGEMKLPGHAKDLEAYTTSGGMILHFEYQIERGSMIHIEEQITRLMERQG